MIYLIAEPKPSDYEIFVIQVMSLAYRDWVDYERMPISTTRDGAERLLDEYGVMYPGRRFRLLARHIQDTVVSQ